MTLIVGLGNLGSRYRLTRHNVGFRVVDRLLEGAERWRRGDRSLQASVALEGNPVILLKPMTFMNLSGEALGAFVKARRHVAGELIVVHDELDLPPGVVRIKKGGGTAGHRGLDSIVSYLERNDFIRVRVGIGRPPETGPATDYVLGVPLGEEETLLAEGERAAAEAVRMILREGLVMAMNRFNRRIPGEAE
ncbi:MAG TPA: aminoacyl-tRNA hydrolase [Atribacteraceae bacterium]|nr:aminoacyl-tRNA hydrolase [Atribacteraceae bacterium]